MNEIDKIMINNILTIFVKTLPIIYQNKTSYGENE